LTSDKRITIPIFDRDGTLAFLKLAKDPRTRRWTQDDRARRQLHRALRLGTGSRQALRIIICEGEFDRLVLESNGFAAVTSTGGAGVFRPEWAEAFAEIPELYLCFDRDEAGRGWRSARSPI